MTFTKRAILAVFLSALLVVTVYAQGGGAILCPDVNGPGAGWGVGYIDLTLSPENVYGPLTVKQATVTSPDHRVYYPAFAFTAPDQKTKEILTERPTLPPFVQGIVRNALDNARPRCRILFLFQGAEPLRVNVLINPPASFTLVPSHNPQLYQTLLDQWFSLLIPENDKTPNSSLAPPAPSMLRNYLRSMLAYRLGLNPDAIGQKNSPWDEVSPFTFTEPTPNLRAKMPYVSYYEDTTLDEIPLENLIQAQKAVDSILEDPTTEENKEQNAANDDMDRFDGRKLMRLSPISPDLCLTAPPLEDVRIDPNAEIEPIAMRVPKNSIYIRFGSFKNFLWFQDLTQSLQGDMMNLFASQSFSRSGTEKTQNLLASRMTEMSKVMGPTVIQDVAFVGSDMFFDDGPSFGLIFHAKNSFLLTSGFTSDRAACLKENPDAKERTVTIAGKKVKHLYTPDGRIQSYYAVDGQFHLLTTSKTLVEEFLKTSDPNESLGAQKYFKFARTQMPLENKYTVFIYASEDFLYRIVSPQYWTEISRRRRSAAEIEMAILARQAALNEGVNTKSLEELVLYGYLPKSVLIRPDGSRLMYDDKGGIYDTRRGYCGLFRPVADMKVASMSDYEIARYESMRDSFQKNIVQLNPIMVGLTVEKADDRNSTVFVDARISPFAQANYERIKSYFGPLDRVRFAPVPGDCIQAQAILNNARLLMGIRNDMPYQGRTGRPLRDVLGGIFGNDFYIYFGTTNEKGFLGLLSTFGIAPIGPPAEYTINSRPDIDMRYRDQHIRLFSLQPELLAVIQPYLAYEIAPTPQHAWLTINNPMTVPIGRRINDMCYAMSARTSMYNLVTLQTMVQQLGIQPADAMSFFETHSSVKMVSPIGGQYVYQSIGGPMGYWTDSALGYTNMRNLGWFSVHAPQGFMAQPWPWFKGGDFQFKVEPSAVQFGAAIDIMESGK